MLKLTVILVAYCIHSLSGEKNIPFVITTWNFVNATSSALDILKKGGSSLDAVERGATVCEELQCDRTVGFGGSPDENSETTLDAMIMDGKTMNVGAVGSLRRVKNAISVARHVLENTKHSFLVGDLATEFALQMGFKEESLTTPESKTLWMDWYNNQHCQPNYWMNVHPDPSLQCGPYHKLGLDRTHKDRINSVKPRLVDRFNHDTIGMVAIDQDGNVVAGTSTNGARFKIPGRIGDSPIPGAGAYADNAVGGAAATGDGDIMLRFVPSFLAVEEMRRGASASAAAHEAVRRIAEHYPSFRGAVIAATKDGEHGAACNGMPTFPYIITDNARDVCELITINCAN